MYNPGFEIKPNYQKMTFEYGRETFGPEVERRHLDDIRQSLEDPNADGPEVVYTIAMDCGRDEDRNDLASRNLLYGACIYAKGLIGREPVRSQGHIHAVSASVNLSTPELYEVWDGTCIVVMQETANDVPGRVYAVKAQKGQHILVPPSWAHMTINADPTHPMTFGAWCVRDFGFDYRDVRAHHGLAYFPIMDVQENVIKFEQNFRYQPEGLIVKTPNDYKEFGIESGQSIYSQYIEDHSRFDFIKNPALTQSLWTNYEP